MAVADHVPLPVRTHPGCLVIGESTAIDALASYSWQGVTAERLMRTLSKEMAKEVEVLAVSTGAGSMLCRTA
jgi:hypothetical protein